MKILHKPHSILFSVIGMQNIKGDGFRPLLYVKYKELEDNLVLYNILTQEVILLYASEKGAFYNPDLNNETTKILIKKWFLVSKDFDDAKFCENYESIYDALRNTTKLKKLTGTTILTTTDCNARCFYCYEKGCSYKTMNEQTANDVADYLIKNYDGNNLDIGWFGGEPLYNVKAIDIIINKLRDNGINYSSKITTNGYLFDKDMIKRAKELWHITCAQITLDGTEEVYNRIKNYIYNDGISPYKKVLDNIEDLLKEKIEVKIRLNIDKHNYKDIYNLVDYLLDRFSKYPNVYIYPHPLYNSKNDKGEFIKSFEHVKFIDEKCQELKDIIFAKIPRIKKNIVFKRDLFHCMADNDSSVMILPDGKLGKCEHYLDSHSIGSIYSDKINVEELKWFKRFFFTSKDCLTCCFRPACRLLACCPDLDKKCDDYHKQYINNCTNNAMEKIYNMFKDVSEEDIKW